MESGLRENKRKGTWDWACIWVSWVIGWVSGGVVGCRARARCLPPFVGEGVRKVCVGSMF